MDVDAVLGGLYELIAPHLTEKQRRLLGNAVVNNIRGESYRMRTHRRLLEETRKGVAGPALGW